MPRKQCAGAFFPKVQFVLGFSLGKHNGQRQWRRGGWLRSRASMSRWTLPRTAKIGRQRYRGKCQHIYQHQNLYLMLVDTPNCFRPLVFFWVPRVDLGFHTFGVGIGTTQLGEHLWASSNPGIWVHFMWLCFEGRMWWDIYKYMMIYWLYMYTYRFKYVFLYVYQ